VKLIGSGKVVILHYRSIGARLYTVQLEVARGCMKKRKTWAFLALGVGVAIAVNSTGNILKLWGAGSRLSEAEQTLVEKEAENATLKARLEEVKSDEFVEREARDKLGMVREGEILVVLPQTEESSNPQAINLPDDSTNWQKWMRLYFGEKK